MQPGARNHPNSFHFLTHLTFCLGLMATWHALPCPAQSFKTVRGSAGDPFRGTVWGLTKDTTGYLWIGADEGLYRYDGYQIKPSRTLADLQQLKGEQIRALIADESGCLWLGSREGLFRMNPETGQVRSYRDISDQQGVDHRVATMAAAKGGGVWVGTRSGLQYLDPTKDRFTAIPLWDHDPGPDAKHIRALVQEPGGSLWVGTNDGLFAWDPEEESRIQFKNNPQQPNTLGGNLVRALCLDGSGNPWIGTTNGLYLYRRETSDFQAFQLQDGSPIDGVNVMRYHPSGHIWIGTRAAGVLVFDTKTHRVQAHTKSEGLPTDNIIEILLDRHGLVWAGSFKAGLAMMDLKPRRFERIALPESASEGEIRALTLDSKGFIWGAGGRDLFRHDPDTGAFQSISPGPPERPYKSRITSLLPDHADRIWALDESGRLLFHDPNTPGRTTFLPAPFWDKGIITALGASRHADAWVAARTGLYPVSVTQGVGEPLFHHWNLTIRTIHECQTGSIWIGTHTGAYFIQGDDATVLNLKRREDNTGINHNTINDIESDARGVTWIATYQGLNRYDPADGGIRTYLERDGLPDTAIRALTLGPEGELWLSTSAGLVRFEPDTGAVRTFDRADGIWASVFNERSVLKTAANQIYFAGVNGYYRFQPQNMFENPHTPRTVVTSFEIFGRQTSLADNRDEHGVITLTRAENFFTLHFAGLEFTNPLKNRYAYKMEGFDSDWIYSGDRRTAGYTNLPGGSYTFRVKAANSDGVWDENSLALPFRIIPPFWERFWFKPLMLLLILIPLMVGRRLYFNKMTRRRNELEAVAEDRTAALKEARHQLLDEARKAGMAEITSGVLHNIGNILNSIAVSATQVMRTLNESRIEKLHMACDLLRGIDPAERNRFLSADPKGRLLPQFLANVNRALIDESHQLENEIQLMLQRIALMNRAVDLERSYGSRYGELEDVDLVQLVEEAISLQEISIKKRDICIERRFQKTPTCRVNNYNLAHVIIKLIRMAVESLTEEPPDARRRTLTITIAPLNGRYNLIEIADNGQGLTEKDRADLFAGGVVNSAAGGLGLQSCKNAIIETGGNLEAVAEGQGRGEIFRVKVPLEQGTRERDHVAP